MNYDEHAQSVTARLVELIETNAAGDWSMPWQTHGISDHLRARNATTGARYCTGQRRNPGPRGLAPSAGPTGEWATYKQWADHGAQVRKGERSAQIIKWVTHKTTDNDQTPAADGEQRETRRLLPRVYAVFNAHQVDGYDSHHHHHHRHPHRYMDRRHRRRRSLRLRPRLLRTGPADRIYVPGIDQYDDPAAFYSTLLHEHVHWTGHTSRLNRPELGKPFDSPEYATEELVAELGSAIACARHGISPQPRPDHAAYLAHWLKALDADPKTLFRSAAAAQRAVDLLETTADTTAEAAAA